MAVDRREVAATLAASALMVALVTSFFMEASEPRPSEPTASGEDIRVVPDPEKSDFPEPTPAPTVTELPVPEQTAVPVEPTPTPLVDEPLAPCETKDSIDCYWDAATMGNGEGRSFVNLGGTIHYTDTPPEGPPPLPADTLVCGHDAKPAIDYNERDGWWAYCEPGLVP